MDCVCVFVTVMWSSEKQQSLQRPFSRGRDDNLSLIGDLSKDGK